MTNMRTPPVVVTGMILGLICMMMATNNNNTSASAQDKDTPAALEAFKKTWAVAPAAFESKEPDLAPKVSWKIDNSITVANRAMITSKSDFKDGYKLTCKWRWIEGEGKYPDSLSVILRSSGEQRKWAHEITSGIQLNFNPAGKGGVTISEWKKDADPKILARVEQKFEQYKQYAIEVTDGGDKITVTIDGKMVIELPVEAGGGKVSIYNREPVAGVRHTSVISDLTVEALKK